MGEEPRGSNGARSTLHGILVTRCATHNQIGPLWCWFPSGWACACSRSLWVSPTTSLVRLGVSPTAASTPTGVFSIRGLRLYFPVLEPWVVWSALLPAVLPGLSMRKCGAAGCYPPPSLPCSLPLSQALLVYLCANVGSQGLLVVRLPACSSHTLPVMSPLHPGCPFLPLRSVWMNVYILSPWCRTSLSFDFLSVLVV